MIYAGIGSRKTPNNVLECIHTLASILAQSEWTLRSGGAIGADQAFEHGARYSRGMCEIYYPEERVNTSMVNFGSEPSYFDETRGSVLACKLIARLVHPNGKNLSKQALELHARNTYQILGKDLNTPCDYVICYTEGGKGEGGTGQAIRIAKLLNIPILDFGLCQNPTEYLKYLLSVLPGAIK